MILTNTLNARFVLVDPTGQRIAGPFPTVLTAIESARTHTTGTFGSKARTIVAGWWVIPSAWTCLPADWCHNRR